MLSFFPEFFCSFHKIFRHAPKPIGACRKITYNKSDNKRILFSTGEITGFPIPSSRPSCSIDFINSCSWPLPSFSYAIPLPIMARYSVFRSF